MVDEAQAQELTYVDPVTKRVERCVTPENIGLAWRQYQAEESCEKMWQTCFGWAERSCLGNPMILRMYVLESQVMVELGLKYDSPLEPDNLRNTPGNPTDFDYRNKGFVLSFFFEVKATEVSKVMRKAIGYHNYTVCVKASSGTTHMKRGRELGTFMEDHFRKEVVRKSGGKPVEMRTEGLPKKKHRTSQQSLTTQVTGSLEVSDLRRQLEASNAEIERLKQVTMQPMENIRTENGLKVRC
jgi:hypothetical protein